jgi:hypothetical protein
MLLTRSRRRLTQLWRATRETVDGNRWPWYSFATLDVLDPERFGKPHWVTAANEFERLLHEDAPSTEQPIEGGTAQ